MEKSKHTPGPWSPLNNIVKAGNNIICTMFGVNEATPVKLLERDANVRLIAAAPELLEAALCAVAALSQNKTFPADIELAKKVLVSAIKKVQGE